jgi:hypothetical protein
MRIDRFGSVVNLTLDNLTPDITVIQGGPGTGKTTLLQFARGVLYGFDASMRSQYLPSTSSIDFGGSITWSHDHHQFTVRRHDNGDFSGHFEALEDGRTGSSGALTEMLQGISADLYSRLFAVDFSRRPEVSELLDEAADCGFSIEGPAIDTAQMQELVGRLAMLQSTLATYGPVDQSLETRQLRRRELLDDIARAELGTTRHVGERSPSETEELQQQVTDAHQELPALRKALDEIAATRQDNRRRLSQAKAVAVNDGTQETEAGELKAQIERWKSVLRDVAARHEAVGRRMLVAVSCRARTDDFDANLFALETTCDCERRQLTRVQAELQVSLRYLEEEHEALVAQGRPAQMSHDEIAELKQQLEQFEAREAELQQRFDALTETVRNNEIGMETLKRREANASTNVNARLDPDREELQEMETLLSENERRETLLESIGETQRQIRRAEEGNGECSILRTATSYLQRISVNELQRIEVTHGNHVWVADAKGHRLSWGQLSESARDKVYISLCLAFVEAHDQRTVPLPLIWKDVFTNFDSRHVPETATLLCEFAREGRQILLLTRHEHVARVFQFMNVPDRKLVATHDWQTNNMPHHDPWASHNLNHQRSVAGDETVDLAQVANAAHEVHEDFHLFDASPIEQSPSLSADNAVRLRRLGLTTVGDLLDVSQDNIAAELSYARISTSMVADWQSQARMMCRVACLREYDARILVACGIREPGQLLQTSPKEVRSMIERFATSNAGRATLLSGTEFELSRVTDWVQLDGSAHDHRIEETGNEAPGQDAHNADVGHVNSGAETIELQFYLDSEAKVVDAPSIGPRSAERLESVGVVLVSDLLAVDPRELAGRLENRRMSTKMITTWQQQALLVCRVPQLRGHDAQVLVAIGVTDAASLAAIDPQNLWGQVERFVDSTAGKRIIRNSNPPDFEEVYHWIESARQTRMLNAA